MADKCDDCGDSHETLDSVLSKVKLQYRIMAAGYFASLIATALFLYELSGLYGALMVPAGFGIYFFHLNMRATSSNLTMLEEAVGNSGAIDSKALEKAQHSGQYL